MTTFDEALNQERVTDALKKVSKTYALLSLRPGLVTSNLSQAQKIQYEQALQHMRLLMTDLRGLKRSFEEK